MSLNRRVVHEGVKSIGSKAVLVAVDAFQLPEYLNEMYLCVW